MSNFRQGLVAKARDAMNLLNVEEQRALFTELGRCQCASLTKVTSAIGTRGLVGAVIGGLIGGVLEASAEHERKLMEGFKYDIDSTIARFICVRCEEKTIDPRTHVCSRKP